MNASELFKAGNLGEALAAQTEEVERDPSDQGKRLFLFELLSFAGDLERARDQLSALRYAEPALQATQRGYRLLLDAEDTRRGFFDEGELPLYLVQDIPFHARLRMDAAVHWMRSHHATGAAKLLGQAASASPDLTVEINGKTYHSLRDADDLFGPVLEVLARGKYYWVPFEHIETLAMNPPRYPRDLLWVPARIVLRDGTAGDVHLAALYPSSSGHPDDRVKLGRLTDWVALETGCVLGIGLRTYLADDDVLSILDWRELRVTAVN